MERSDHSRIKEPLLAKNGGIYSKSAAKKGRTVTVELSILLYFVGSMGLMPLADQYFLYYFQKQDNFTSSANTLECVQNISDQKYTQGAKYQAQATNVAMTLSIVMIIPSLFSTIQMGGISDSIGRKPVLNAPLVGVIIRCIFYMVFVFFELPLEFFVIPYLIDGLLGGPTTLMMACFAYIADVTTHQDRSFRQFLIDVAICVGMIISNVGMGFLIRALGYLYPALILLGINVINLLYSSLILRESIREKSDVEWLTCKYLMRQVSFYSKDDGNGRRWKIILNSLILMLICMPLISGGAVIIFFQLDAPICFTSIDIGIWSAQRYLISGISGALALKLCYTSLGDLGLMVLGSTSNIIFFVLIAFARSKTYMYIVAFTSVFNTLAMSMPRAYCSKIVKPNEQGSLMSALACAQTLSIALGQVLLNTIYTATLRPPNFKGTTFIVQAGLASICLIFIIILIIGTRGQKKGYQELNSKGTM